MRYYPQERSEWSEAERRYIRRVTFERFEKVEPPESEPAPFVRLDDPDTWRHTETWVILRFEMRARTWLCSCGREWEELVPDVGPQVESRCTRCGCTTWAP